MEKTIRTSHHFVSWNPVTGCTEVGPGCERCYAKRIAERHRGVPGHPYEQGFDVKLWPERLSLPFSWKRSRHVFVCSMADLFHKEVPDAYIFEVFRVMAYADWHTFQVLTKRSSRLAHLAPSLPWPPHIWAGVSIELNRMVARADHLRQVPAAIRYISAQPLLGPLPDLNLEGIHWVIAGGESGPGARPMRIEWVRDLRDRCVAAGIPFYFNQWGGITAQAGGRELDGRTWDEVPIRIF